MSRAYYNEFDPYAAQWLRNLISAGHIAPGDVDERSIVDVQPDDLEGYTQCHFFAGIGGWSLAARLAGWSDSRPLWTGSCPCQPFSVAGKGEGQKDERHLWPEQFRLIRARRPDVWMGEQVAAAVGKHWLDGVHSDLESIGYASGAAVVPACAVDAPHRRDRAWIVADARGGRCTGQGEGQDQQPWRAKAFGSGESYVANAAGERREGRAHAREQQQSADVGSFPARSGELCDVANAHQSGEGEERQQRGGELGGPGGDTADRTLGHAEREGLEGQRGHGHHRDEPGRFAAHAAGSIAPASSVRRNSTAWSGAEWIAGADGKARRFEPSIRLLAHGVPARVGKLRAYGNAIVPQVGAEIIAAYMECYP